MASNINIYAWGGGGGLFVYFHFLFPYLVTLAAIDSGETLTKHETLEGDEIIKLEKTGGSTGKRNVLYSGDPHKIIKKKGFKDAALITQLTCQEETEITLGLYLYL